MYAGIDIGGSKTLVASLDVHGVITEKIRFETPKKYDDFLAELRTAFGALRNDDFVAGGVGAPGSIDRHHGRGISFGNLGWKNIPILTDVENITRCPMVLENDAKLAALSEAMLVKDTYDKVLYVTISTGIGMGLIVDRTIQTGFGDGGGRTMLVEHNGRLESWESFASGKAIVARYGKKAADIKDKKTWQAVVRDLVPGFIELIALTQPDVVVIGGSVGTHFAKYGELLQAELKKFETPLLPIPSVLGAGRPEEAVLFGCYDLAKATFRHSHLDTHNHSHGAHLS
jgi:predicted NBD/HSP70 family sugar kinase